MDVDKDVVRIIAEFGDADSFLKLNGVKSIDISDIMKDSSSNIKSGSYQITLKLDDTKSLIPYYLTIVVIDPPPVAPKAPEPEVKPVVAPVIDWAAEILKN